MRRLAPAFLICAAWALASAAGAQPTAPSEPDSSHAQSDRDGDGRVDRQEYHDRQTDVFFFCDANKDGGLTAAEAKDVTAERFRAADRNADGVLSLEEFHEARVKDFRAADKNKDGGLTAAEVEAHRSASAP